MQVTIRFVAVLALFVGLCSGCGPKSTTKEAPEKVSDQSRNDGDKDVKQGSSIPKVDKGSSSGQDLREKDKTAKGLGDPQSKLLARDLIAEKKKDTKAFLAKYEGKTVEVTGLVSEVTDAQAVYLDDEKWDPVKRKFSLVSCAMVDHYPGKVVFPGQTATLKGRVTSNGGDEMVVLHDVEIVKVEGARMPPLTADALAAEFAKDHDAATKKYKDKWIDVSGDSVSVEKGKYGSHDVVLKTVEKAPRVVAVFPGAYRRLFAAGDKFEAICKAEWDSEAKRVELNYIILTAKPK